MPKLTELKCPNCGAKLEQVGDVDRVSCPHCGTDLVIERKAVFLAQEEGPLRCPQCGKVDRVQKVSATYSSGVSDSGVSGWTVDSAAEVGVLVASGQSQTRLSRLLSPPAEPASPHLDSDLLLFWSLLIAAPSALFVLAGLGTLLLSLWIGAEWLQSPTGELAGATGSIVFAVLGVLGVALGAVLWLLPIAKSRKQLRSEKQRCDVQRPIWQRAMNRWERLYYCARDDGVFIPGETPFVPIEKIQEFLYAD